MIARIALIAALVAAASAASYGKCTAPGDRCAGEKGYPAVPWIGCCAKTESCLPDETRGYGRFCVKKPSDYGKGKCYASGARCMGANGKPFVPFHKCCNKGETCQQDKKRGWGGFCAGAAKGYKEAERKAAVQKKSPAYAPKCYKRGKRCMGAKGYPYHQWYHCCDAEYKCVADAKMSWGGFCKKLDDKYVKKYGEVSRGYDYNPKFAPKSYDYNVPEVKPKSQGDDYFAKNDYSSYSTDTGYDYGYGYGSKDKKAKKAKKDKKEKPKVTNAPNVTTVKPAVTTVKPAVTTVKPAVTTVKPVVTTATTAAPVTLPANNLAVTQLGLGPNFGCAIEAGEQPATSDTEPAFAGLATTSSLDLQVDIPACGAGSTFSDADKQLVLNAVCAPLIADGIDAVCILEQVPSSTATTRMLADDDLTAVARQTVIIIRWRIRIFFSTSFGARVLIILTRITVFIFSPTLPSPDS